MLACHLKSTQNNNGLVLSATSIDANHKLVVFAVAFVAVENKPNWTYFLGELKKSHVIADWSKILFISDRDKG